MNAHEAHMHVRTLAFKSAVSKTKRKKVVYTCYWLVMTREQEQHGATIRPVQGGPDTDEYHHSTML